MNAKEALERISDLLKVKFNRLSFATTALVDGTEITNNLDQEFAIGQELYVVNESTLSPAYEGTHETREGLLLTVDSSSVIIAIEQKATEAPANEGGDTTSTVTDEGMEEEVSVEVPEEASDVLTEEVVQAVVDALTPVVEEVKTIAEEMKMLKEKMEKYNSEFQQYKKQPEKFSVNEAKKTHKNSIEDYKLEVFKAFRK